MGITRKRAGKYTLAALSTNVELSLEWDFDANDGLTPDDVTLGSGRIVHWVCRYDHRWTARVIDRSRGSGCAQCLHLHPDASRVAEILYLMAEWDHGRNHDVDPSELACTSYQSVWWVCEKGHSWDTPVRNRYVLGHGCPVCLGRRVTEDNCLATVFPHLARQWDKEANRGLKPTDVTAKSNRRVGWVCQEGHRWQARIDHRARGNRCPQCSRARKRSRQGARA